MQTVIVYMYAAAWLFTTKRRYWSNVSRRCGQLGVTRQCAGEGTLSGPLARQMNLTYSNIVLTRRGQDFEILSATRPLFKC